MDPKNPVILFNRLYSNLSRLRLNDADRITEAEEDVRFLKTLRRLPGFVYLIVA